MPGVPDRTPAISLRDVTKRFAGSTTAAVDGLTLDIAPGEIVAFVGPSGCGKTTTLKMINRLIEPTSGTIHVLGKPQDAVPAHELRRRIGYVIQQIGLFPHQTIRRNIAAVPDLLGWERARIDERCDELVELVGLEAELLDRYPAELSGGQQQRVGVARALAADPPILLMDEPYSAVDPIVRERLQDELLALQDRVRKTIVIVTHDIDEAIRLADRVAILDVGGVLEQYDPPADLLSAPASAFVASFLGRERGLRRLALLRVGDIDPVDGPIVAIGATYAQAVAAARTHGTSWVGVQREDGLLLGWRPVEDFEPGAAAERTADGTVDELELRDFVAIVRPSTPLRQALDVIVTSHSRMATVVDDEGRYLGVITIDQVAGGLQS